MMTFLRKHRTWLMTVIGILSIPFIFYFVQKPDYGAMHGDDFAKVYDRNVSMVEARHYARLYELAMGLGMSRLVQDLTVGVNDPNQRAVQFILNLIVLRHEAERLGIRVPDSEVAELVRNLRVFRGPTGFDIKKYNEFTQQVMSPNGQGEAQIEELAKDELTLNRIKQLVATGVRVPESEAKENYEQAYGKLSASVIRLSASGFVKEVKVTDDDVQKYFDSHKNELKTDEKRKIEFVGLSLSEEQKKLTGKERIDVLQKLADRATDFTQALLEQGPQFQDVAAKFQLPVQVTGEFTAADPDPKFKASPELGTASFQLTPEEPNSEPIQVAEGFYLLHLAGTIPSRPLTLDEAKPKISDAIKARRSREMVTNKAAQAVHDLREGLRAGQPLAFACEKVNVKAQKVPPFTLYEDLDPKDPKDPNKTNDRPADFLAIKNAVSGLQPGDVSDFYPSEDGGIIAVLEKRELPDQAKYKENKAVFDERILKNKQQVVFFEWLRDRQREAGLFKTKS